MTVVRLVVLLSLYRACLELARNSKCHQALGSLLLSNGDLAAAETELAEPSSPIPNATKRAATSALSFANKASSSRPPWNTKEAVRPFPDDPSIGYILAQILQKTGHSAEAAAQLQAPRRKINSKGIEISPIAT